MGGFKLGKIFGFQISIDWSWLFIFFLVVYTLAVGYFPVIYPGLGGVTNWGMAVVAALLLFVSVLIHELSHSLVARSYGGEVKGITLFLFGGVSQTADEPKAAREEFWMAVVGPLTSFALAGGFYALFVAGSAAKWPIAGVAILSYLAWINLLLGVFNLIPGFPLDGGRVLRSLIWGATNDLTKATWYASLVGQGFGYLLMIFGVFLIFGGNLIGGLWMIFIGWFLNSAARSAYQQLLVRQALSGVPVERVMTTDVPAVDAGMTVREFVDDKLLRHDHACYPVTSGETAVGVVGAEEVRAVPSNAWSSTTLGDIAHRLDDATEIGLRDDAWDALVKLTTGEACRLLVIEDDHLKGTVGRESLFRLVRTKMQLGI